LKALRYYLKLELEVIVCTRTGAFVNGLVSGKSSGTYNVVSQSQIKGGAPYIAVWLICGAS
jgi:hypothetical protein